MEQQFHLKRLIVLMSSVLLVIAQMGAFTYIWFHSYVYLGALDKPFYFMGNFAVIGLYTVMLLLFFVNGGICAMLSFDHDLELEANVQAMEAAVEAVKSGSITYAARDSEFDGRSIQEGDHMALIEGKLLETGKDFFAVIQALAANMCKDECNFITIIYGEGADEAQADKVREIFQQASGDAEINVLCGGQPVYSYLISVE